MAQAPRDENRITALLGTSTSTSLTLPIGAIPISGVNPLTVAVVDATGTQITSFGGSVLNNDLVDTGNSTTTPLAGNASFTGTGKDTLGYSYVSVYVYSDQNSASAGVKIEFSSDNSNWNDATVDTFTAGNAAPNDGQTYLAPCRARYFRVVYTNGATLQTTFRLNSVLRVGSLAGDVIPVADVPTALADHAQLVKSALMGKTTAGGGTWVDVKVNPSGALTAAVTAADGDVFVRSNAASTFPVNATQVTSPWVISGAVTEATLDAAIVSQGTALGTIKNLMTAGSVTTAAPTYTTGNINPLSLTTSGALRVDLGATSANATAVKVDGSAVTQPVSGTVSITSNSAVNVAQMNGVATTMGNGVSGTGVQRVTIASDSTGTLAGVTTVTTLTNQSQEGGVNISLNAGAVDTGTRRVVQANGAGKTIVSKSGSASTSGNNTLVAAGTNRLKVFAFSLSTSSTTALTVKFQDGASGTDLWSVILQAPTSISTGANLAVSPPAWLFATSSATLLNLNLSSANAVQWSVSYFDEA